MENGSTLQPSGIKVQSVFLPLLPQSTGCSVLLCSVPQTVALIDSTPPSSGLCSLSPVNTFNQNHCDLPVSLWSRRVCSDVPMVTRALQEQLTALMYRDGQPCAVIVNRGSHLDQGLGLLLATILVTSSGCFNIFPSTEQVDLEASAATARCLRAPPAELGKRKDEKWAVICMQKLEYRRSAIV